MTSAIHETAIVHPQAQVGTEVQIGPYCVVDAEVRIGRGTRLDPFVHIQSHTTLGEDNHVHSYACVGGVPQDLKFQGEQSVLEIGDRNTIREYVTLNRGTADGGGLTRVGSDCLLMAYSHVAHDCQVADGVILANAATLAGHVSIGAHAVIGGLSAVHQFVTIGEFCFIGGKTGVAQDVPPYVLAAGERASMRGLNLVGLKRRGFNKETIQALRKVYSLVLRSGLTRDEAIAQALQQWGDIEQVQRFLEFIQNSERGVIPQERSPRQ
ncbi:MAG: acyl-ACP--UDP-N-acetylglucosamine O-acyltransferase [Thermodesulfobacteriota bacterium]